MTSRLEHVETSRRRNVDMGRGCQLSAGDSCTPVVVSTCRLVDLSTCRRPAFSLAEMMIAIGILGIGMTMVAMFFPVAMSQHSDTTIQQRAMEIAQRAKSYVLSAQARPALLDSDRQVWQLILNNENGAPEYDPFMNWRTMILPPMDPNRTPPNPILNQETINDFATELGREVRYVWCLFGRPSGGVTQYMIAVCRVMPGQRFLNFPNDGDSNIAYVTPLPRAIAGHWMVWGLPLAQAGSKVLQLPAPVQTTMEPWKSKRLSSLLPAGSKLIGKRSGLVYSVLDVDIVGGLDTVTLREEMSPAELERQFPTDPVFPVFMFFPPPVKTGIPVGTQVAWPAVDFGDQSPWVAGLYF